MIPKLTYNPEKEKEWEENCGTLLEWKMHLDNLVGECCHLNECHDLLINAYNLQIKHKINFVKEQTEHLLDEITEKANNTFRQSQKMQEDYDKLQIIIIELMRHANLDKCLIGKYTAHLQPNGFLTIKLSK